MIVYGTGNESADVTVIGNEVFMVTIHRMEFDREALSDLRWAIDQALNTSAEELEASGE